MVKLITRFGLMLMEPEERQDWINSLVTGKVIDCKAVGELIDTCKKKCYELTQAGSDAVSEQEKIQIRWMLTKVNGLQETRSMDPEELAEWVVDLRENGTMFSSSDLVMVAKAMMRRK